MLTLLRYLPVMLISLSLTAQTSLDTALDSLDRYYARALKEWKVPGMAIAIVKDGELIFAKGYGTRNINTRAPVNTNTLFAIASNTKAFTSTALAMLADQGKLSWSDKVREHLPWFELYAPYVSENFTIRDLLTHRSGLKTFSGDLLWYGTDLSREEVVRNARYLEPEYGFRAHYGYSNIMYLAAGLIIEKASGKSWDAFIRERILDPLGMDRTISSTHDLAGFKNVSAPHNDYRDTIIAIDWLNWDNIAPAGGLISTVSDVSRWLFFQLDRGVTPGGDTLIRPERFREMWAPQTIQYVSPWSESMWPSTHFKSYGLGWALFDYHGRKVIGHGGGYDGFISNTTFVPEEKLGFVILTNKNSSLYYPLKFKTLDILLDAGEHKDWSTDFLATIEQGREKQEGSPQSNERAKTGDTGPTLPPEAYHGTYHCKMYGDARVFPENDQLKLHLVPTEIFLGNLEHRQYNTWNVEFEKVPSLPGGTVNFLINAEGEVEEMQIDIPNPDFDFTELRFFKVANK